MSIVENPASQAHGHTWRQEEVKGEPGHPVAALLPSVLGLVVLEAEPLEGNLQQPWGWEKEKNIELEYKIEDLENELGKEREQMNEFEVSFITDWGSTWSIKVVSF